MSMPSSRLEVATTAGSRPDLSASSIWDRSSFDTDPWWARTISGITPLADPACAIIAAGVERDAGGTGNPFAQCTGSAGPAVSIGPA